MVQVPEQSVLTKLEAQNILFLSLSCCLLELWPAPASPTTKRSTHQSPGDAVPQCVGTSQF